MTIGSISFGRRAVRVSPVLAVTRTGSVLSLRVLGSPASVATEGRVSSLASGQSNENGPERAVVDGRVSLVISSFAC